MEDPLSIRRHTLPSTLFVDPAIVRYIEKSSSSSSSSVFLNHLPQQQAQQEEDEGEEDGDSIISSSIASSSFMQHQKPSPPQPTASTSLDHLWSKQERYDSLELRLFALEESERRFEHRLQVLEKNKTSMLQPMKPDQHGQEIMQQQHLQKQQHHSASHPHDAAVVDDSNYMELYHSLLKKYNQLQIETKEKEAYYQQRIKQLTEKQQQQQPCQEQTKDASSFTAATEKKKEQVTETEAYREEDGYLIFDTTSMNGEITHCRVKIPSSQTCHINHKQDPSSIFASPPATRVGSPQYHSSLPSSHHYYHHHHHITSPKKGLNPNAPEWRKSSYHH
ncbi:hypothetical protein MAM1_0091c04885 [Mucor ambiguus]|uniref:Uncharacterized protein n=1 Tax=Mucor ambiguus TaxID=91626 RepID=A0A0C9MDM3_9FUNG|nr:hypothetical protein MAM1_0091c04885 [Mucor ambiguus]